jgi:hypothetical protein
MTSLDQVQLFVADVWRKTKNSLREFPELFHNGEPKYPLPLPVFFSGSSPSDRRNPA